MADNLVTEWKRIKTVFEQSTQKKKPGESLLIFFTKSSGLTPALKDLDAAWDDYAAFIKARAKFWQVKAAYLPVMGKAATDAKQAKQKETDAHKKEAIDNLVAEIARMGLDIENLEITISNRAGYFDACMADALQPAAAAADEGKKLITHSVECIGKLEAIIKGKKAFIAELVTTANQMTKVEETLRLARDNYDAVVGSGPTTKDTKILDALRAADLALKNYGSVSKKVRESVQEYRKLLNEPG